MKDGGLISIPTIYKSGHLCTEAWPFLEPQTNMDTSYIRARRAGRPLKQLILPKRHAIEEEGVDDTAEPPEPLSPAAILFHQPHFNCYIIAILGFGTKIDVEHAKAGLDPTLLRHPRFSSIQVN